MEFKLEELLIEISGDINKFYTANSFMTDEAKIMFFDEEEDIETLRNYSEKNNYDILLIKKKNNRIAYIESEDIKNCKNVKEILNNISEEEKITIDTQMPKIIDKFKEFPHVFVYDKKNLFKGVITYADLNKPPLYSYLYIFISNFERLLRNVIEIKYEKDNWLKKLSDGNKREVGSIFIESKAKEIELSLLECTTITQLKEILSKEKEITSLDCYKGKKSYESKLNKIIGYRNGIMHNRKIIKSKENYADFYEFLYDFCNQIKEIKNYIK